MELLAASAIVDRISAARQSLGPMTQGAVLAFDGDGTLWRGDVGEDFFMACVKAARFLPVATRAMLEVGRAAGLLGLPSDGDDHGDGVAIARSLLQGYLDHRVAEDLFCEVIAWACAGWTEDDVNALASRVVEEEDVHGRMHVELDAVFAWAKREGIEVYLVSASPRPVVEAAGALLGFDRAHVLATTAPFEAGILQATAIRPIPYGPGKAAQLRERIGERVLLAAFGDNVFDVPMLEAARVPVVVEPKPRLLARLAATDDPAFAGRAGQDGWYAPVRVQIAEV